MDIQVFRNEIKSNAILWYDFKKDATILSIGDDFNGVENVDDTAKFDYIIIKDNLDKFAIAQYLLKPNGVILLLVNNKYGLANTKNIGYTKKEIEKALKKAKIKTYKFYYPLSNYEQANTIFSDDYLPEYNNSKLLNNVFYNNRQVIKYNEIEAIKTVTKAGKFVDYTNSYIVEIGNISPIKFISYNNSRKDDFRLVTKVYNDKVVKEPVKEVAKSHIEQIRNNIENLKKQGFHMLDTYEDGKIVSQYIEGKTLYDEIVSLINTNLDEAYKSIENWYNYIKEKSTNLDGTYIDLVLENTFYKDGEYLFFDQEWKMDDTPLEFILYRTINNLYTYNPEISNIIDRTAFFEKFNLNDKIEIFKSCEQKLQEKVVNAELIKAYDEQYREKYKNVVPFEFYRKKSILKNLLNKLRN